MCKCKEKLFIFHSEVEDSLVGEWHILAKNEFKALGKFFAENECLSYMDIIDYFEVTEETEKEICQCGSCESIFLKSMLVNNECPYCKSGNWINGYIDE